MGWRIDYFFVSEELRDVSSAFILAEVTGADHCPVGIELDVVCPEPMLLYVLNQCFFHS